MRNCLLLHNTVFIATVSDVNILQNWGWGIFLFTFISCWVMGLFTDTGFKKVYSYMENIQNLFLNGERFSKLSQQQSVL